jgi:hypothetical protein
MTPTTADRSQEPFAERRKCAKSGQKFTLTLDTY